QTAAIEPAPADPLGGGSPDALSGVRTRSAGAAAHAQDRVGQRRAGRAERTAVLVEDYPLAAELDASAAGVHPGRLDALREPGAFGDEATDRGVQRVDLPPQHGNRVRVVGWLRGVRGTGRFGGARHQVLISFFWPPWHRRPDTKTPRVRAR